MGKGSPCQVVQTYNGWDMIRLRPASWDWDSRIKRSKALAGRFPSARDTLAFYQEILIFQKQLYEELKERRSASSLYRKRKKGRAMQYKLDSYICQEAISASFPASPSLLSIARGGPEYLAGLAKEVSCWDRAAWLAALDDCKWSLREQPLSFFPKVLIQPYLQLFIEWDKELQEVLGDHEQKEDEELIGESCPFCEFRPQLAYLYPVEKASPRFLVCSLCNGEWPCIRLSCPCCRESDKRKLSYFVAQECPSVRLDVCDTCGKYIKTIDMGIDPEAVPVVDELATITLDIWVKQRGYKKLELNIAGI